MLKIHRKESKPGACWTKKAGVRRMLKGGGGGGGKSTNKKTSGHQ